MARRIVCGVAIPGHNVVGDGRSGHSSRGISLHSLHKCLLVSMIDIVSSTYGGFI